MDNNKLIIGIIVAIVAFFAAPIVMQRLRPAAAPVASTAQQGAPATASNAYSAPQNPAYSPAQPQAQMQQQPQMALPGGLNAQTLVGTIWEVTGKQGTVKFQFNAGGQGIAMHPIVGQLPASWNCAGNQVNVTATAFNQTMSISAQIQGNDLVGQGCTIRRLQ